jgi:ceramide glucosyltransferase
MMWRRADLAAAGGLAALGEDAAEDAAATKLVRASGFNVHLVDAPFAQPLGRRAFREVWQRQSRWARLRRACFPHFFLPEFVSGALFPLLALAVVAQALDWPVAPSLVAFASLWYGGEMLLAGFAGWPVTARYPLQGMLRDLMLPLLWIDGWLGSDFVWRGNAMSVAAEGQVEDGKAG